MRQAHDAILAAFLEYPGHGLGPGQNETTQARMKIPRQAQMATVGSQAVGGPRGVQGQDQGHCKGQGQKRSKGQNFRGKN